MSESSKRWRRKKKAADDKSAAKTESKTETKDAESKDAGAMRRKKLYG